MATINTFSKHLSNYLSDFLPSSRAVSRNTIASYCDAFRLFLGYCENERGIRADKFSFQHFTNELVEDFLAWLEKERGCSVSTRNQRLAALHSFVRYAQLEEPPYIQSFQRILSIPFKKKGGSLIKYLSTDEVKSILEQPNTTTSTGRRDLAILTLLYDTGARVQEICDLSVRDIRHSLSSTVRLVGKGRKARLIPISSNTSKIVEHYLVEQKLTSPEKQDHPLFFNRQGQRLSRTGVAYILRKYVGLSNALSAPDKISPHVLRHSKAMHLLQAGVNIVYIRDILGHADLKTTEIYARADPEARRKAIEMVAPKISSNIPPWASDNGLLSWLKSFGKV